MSGGPAARTQPAGAAFTSASTMSAGAPAQTQAGAASFTSGSVFGAAMAGQASAATFTSGSLFTIAGAVAGGAPSLTALRQRTDATHLYVTPRTVNVSSVGMNVSTNVAMTGIVGSASAQTPDGNGRAQLTYSGLTRYTVYYFQLTTGGSPFGSVFTTKTRPAPWQVTGYKVGHIGCITNNATDAAAGLTALNAEGVDFIEHYGDYGYWDSSSSDTTTRAALYDSQQAGVTGLAAFEQNYSFNWLRSDHDGATGDNLDSTDPTCAAAIAALQVVAPNQHYEDARSPKLALYWSEMIGRIEHVHIDLRTIDRTVSTATDDSSKTFLGATQTAWLKAKLSTGTHPIVLHLDTRWPGPADPAPPVKGDWVPAYTAWRADIVASTGWSRVKLISHSDDHFIGWMSAAHNAANGGGSTPVVVSAPMGNTGGGRNPATAGYDSYWQNGGARVSQYVVMTYTDDGATITGTAKGYDATNSATRFTQQMFSVVYNAGAAGFTSGSVFGAAATAVDVAGSGFTSGSSFGAAGVRQTPSAAGFISGSAMSAGAPTQTQGAAATFVSGSSLGAAGARTTSAAAAFTSGSGMAATGSPGPGFASFASASSFTAFAGGAAGAATFASGSAFTAGGSYTAAAAAAFASGSSMGAAGTNTTSGAAAFISGSVFTATATNTTIVAAAFTSASLFGAAGATGAAAGFASGSAFTATGSYTAAGTAAPGVTGVVITVNPAAATTITWGHPATVTTASVCQPAVTVR